MNGVMWNDKRETAAAYECHSDSRENYKPERKQQETT